jgi:SAM-dependent methyltransferase
MMINPRPGLMQLSQIIAETHDYSLSMVSGGVGTLTEMRQIVNLAGLRRCVEIGCANGTNTNILARDYPYLDVWGFDPQRPAIEAAQRQAEQLRLRNVFYSEADARNSPARSKSMDVVFAGGILAFVPENDRKKVISECKRIVTPPGWILAVPVYFPDEVSDPAIVAAVEALIGVPIHTGPAQPLKDLWEGCGLDLVEEIHHEFAYHTEDEVRAYVEGVIDRCAGEYSAQHLDELYQDLLYAHLIFRENNRRACYGTWAFRTDIVVKGPYLLDGMRSSATQ